MPGDEVTASDEAATLFPLGDAFLLGIRWIGDGSDVAIDLKLPDRDRPVALCCSEAAVVDVNLPFERNIKRALLWKGQLESKENGGYSLVLEFGGDPEGEVSLECNAVTIEEVPWALGGS